MPKLLITLTILFLSLSVVFGVLNTNKARSLRETAARSDNARATAEHARMAKEKEIRERDAEAGSKHTDTEAKVASAEADLVNLNPNEPRCRHSSRRTSSKSPSCGGAWRKRHQTT